MARNDRPGDIARADRDRAARERAARGTLGGLGADGLAPRPWRPPPVPPSAVDLLEFFAWWSSSAGPEDVRAGAPAALELLQAAREELDALETGVLFAARGAGLTWREMAQAMGLGSPQACQQRLDRLLSRRDDDA